MYHDSNPMMSPIKSYNAQKLVFIIIIIFYFNKNITYIFKFINSIIIKL